MIRLQYSAFRYSDGVVWGREWSVIAAGRHVGTVWHCPGTDHCRLRRKGEAEASDTAPSLHLAARALLREAGGGR